MTFIERKDELWQINTKTTLLICLFLYLELSSQGQYLGHKNTASTQIYLQFTADMFPHVMSAIESSFGEVIPELELK